MKIAAKEINLKNNTVIVLRSPLVPDAENMLTHLRTSHSESYRNLNQSARHWNSITVADEEKILLDFEISKHKFMLAAFSNGQIIGGLGIVGQTAEFVTQSAHLGMSIQKAFCGAGIGTAIMSYALAEAIKLNLHRIELSVRTYNESGIALYEKCGFERVGLLKDTAFIDGQFVNEFLYQKILS